jgi:hypothetical protein
MQALQRLADASGIIELKPENALPSLKLIKTVDPLNSAEFFLVYFRDDEWVA